MEVDGRPERLNAAWAFLIGRMPDLADLPELHDATFVEDSCYLLERAYERYKPRSKDFEAFVLHICAAVDRYPELAPLVRVSFGETEFLMLTRGSLAEGCAYLRRFPNSYRDIVGWEALVRYLSSAARH